MEIAWLNFIFAFIQGFCVITFGQIQVGKRYNIKRLQHLLGMGGARIEIIHSKIQEMERKIRRLEIKGHSMLFLLFLIQEIILSFRFYVRPEQWWHPFIILCVSVLFLRIAFWLKGATIVSHIDADEIDNSIDFF